MDDRLKFLYCDATELRGHAREAPPGMEIRGKAEREGTRKTRCQKRPPRDDRNQVGKRAGRASRKAAIVHIAPVPQTDTGGKGEEPKAGGRSIVKELGKMTP